MLGATSLFKVSAQSAAILSFDPSTQSVSRNQNITMGVKLNAGGNNISAVEIRIAYDKNKLDFVGFNADPAAPWGNIVENIPDTANGKVFFSIINNSDSFPQNINLGTLSFRTKNTDGQTSVGFNYTKVNASGSYTPLTNITKQDGVVTIGSNASPSPTPSGQTAYLTLSPSSSTISVGQDFQPTTVKLFGGDNNLANVGFTLPFDRNKLTAVSINPIAGGGLTSEIDKTINNDTGTIRYVYSRPIGGNITRDSSGAVAVATVVFRAKQTAGQAFVNFTNVSATTTSAITDLPIGTNQGATYTIQSTASSPTPTPSATPTPAGSPSPTPSVTPSPSVSPSPLPKVVSMEFDATNVPFALRGQDVTLPITINTAITGTIYNVTALDTTIKYDKTKFDYVSLTVDPNSGFNAECSRTGQGAGTFCVVMPINSNGTVRLSTAVSTAGAVVAGDPVIANLKLRPKRVAAASQDPANPDIKFETALMTGGAQGIASGPLGVDAKPLNLEIKETSFTKFYQICEANGDVDWDSRSASILCLQQQEYKFYRNTGKVIAKDYELRDKTPGLKTIFVGFVSTDNREIIERVLVNFQPNPRIDSITCNFAGEGMEAIIFGSNFYNRDNNSSIKINNQQAEIIEWTDQNVVLPSNAPSSVSGPLPPPGSNAKLWRVKAKITRQSKDNVPIELKSSTNVTISSSCQVGVTTLDFSARTKCGPMPSIPKEEVDVALYENNADATVLVKSKVKVDSKGKPQGLAPSLQKDKDYVIVIKAPKALSRRIDFKAKGSGTTALDIIDLPIGNIAPAAAPDSRINSLDRSELVKQWTLTTDADKTGDFNEDLRVNSIDWACMRENFNKDDETFSGTR